MALTICLAVLAGLAVGCGGRAEDPRVLSAAPPDGDTADDGAAAALWQRMDRVGRDARDLASLSGSVFALSRTRLLRSDSLGMSWTRIDTSPWTWGRLSALDADDGNLYVAGYHLAVSRDKGESFEVDFSPVADGCSDVDYEEGVGWCTVRNWGHDSGVWHRPLGAAWEHGNGGRYFSGSAWRVVADPADPTNRAYLTCEYGGHVTSTQMTTDGGHTWQRAGGSFVHSSFMRGAAPTAFARSSFTRNQGQRWIPLGLDTRSVVKDGPRRRMFAAGTSAGVFVGGPRSWRRYGLTNRVVISLAVCSDHLFALTDTGAILRTPLAVGPSDATWPEINDTDEIAWKE